jgi:hypothetical protein
VQSDQPLGYHHKCRNPDTPWRARAPKRKIIVKELAYLEHIAHEDEQLHGQPNVFRIAVEVYQQF